MAPFLFLHHYMDATATDRKVQGNSSIISLSLEQKEGSARFQAFLLKGISRFSQNPLSDLQKSFISIENNQG